MFSINIENLKTLKYHILRKNIKKNIRKKLSIVHSKSGHEYKKIFKEESIEILKIFDLITNIEEYQ